MCTYVRTAWLEVQIALARTVLREHARGKLGGSGCSNRGVEPALYVISPCLTRNHSVPYVRVARE